MPRVQTAIVHENDKLFRMHCVEAWFAGQGEPVKKAVELYLELVPPPQPLRPIMIFFKEKGHAELLRISGTKAIRACKALGCNETWQRGVRDYLIPRHKGPTLRPCEEPPPMLRLPASNSLKSPDNEKQRGRGWNTGLLALFVLAVPVFLGGCQTFVPSPPAQPSLPATYRGTTAGMAVDDRWWHDFRSPALNNVIEEGLQAAPDIRIALARLDQARAVAAKTGSGLWPSLSGGADASRTANGRDGGGQVNTTAYGLGLAASYELDLWGRIGSLHQADLLEVSASADDLRTVALTVSGEIAETWISLCSARQQLAVLDAQQRTNNEILSTLELRFANSLASALDVLQQREAIAQTNTRIAPLQAEVLGLENRLNLLTGKPPGSIQLSAADTLPPPLPFPVVGIPADLLRDRPDIRAGWNRLVEAGWNVAAAKADRLPALRLTGAFEYNGEALHRVLDNWLARLAFGLTLPIIDGGSRAAEVRRQKAVAAERLAAYEKTVLTALSEVDSAVHFLRKRQELRDALLIQRKAVEQALSSARIRYQNGVVTYDIVLNLLLKLQQLERTVIQEEAALLINQAGLCRALGKGWQSAFPLAPSISRTHQP
jgi:NodT family efflux transporter outer membrane factor (OMF) lipoprotein